MGSDNTGREEIMGKDGLGTMNENGELFAEFCTFNDLVIDGSVFPHKTMHKATWVSPERKQTEPDLQHNHKQEMEKKSTRNCENYAEEIRRLSK